MKNIITVLFLALTTIGFSQKMKFKNDQILFDKTPVANLTREKGVFTFSNVDNSTVFFIGVERCAISGKFYLEFTNSTTKVKNEMPLTEYSAMNEKKYVSIALEKAGFVTADGFQMDKINAFIDGEKFDLAKEYGCKMYTEGKAKIVDMNVKILKNGKIIKGNNIALGSISRSITLNVIKYEIHTYTLLDSIGNLIATAEGTKTGGYFTGIIRTKDKKEIKIPMKEFFGFDYSCDKDENIEMMLIILIQNGYTL